MLMKFPRQQLKKETEVKETMEDHVGSICELLTKKNFRKKTNKILRENTLNGAKMNSNIHLIRKMYFPKVLTEKKVSHIKSLIETSLYLLNYSS